jgi:branched-chain amino acid transport system ATP-binding protein
MTVLENALVGALFGGQNRPGFYSAAKFAADCLSTVGLDDRADTIVGNLNVADRKRLELARALAGSPSVLLLDELFAGTSTEIVTSLAQTVRRVSAMGVAVVVVEHLMGVVTALCDRVLVLVEGQLIAEGRPDVVLRDERVIAAYLGTSDAGN